VLVLLTVQTRENQGKLTSPFVSNTVDNMAIEDQLAQLGLDAKEARFYLAALELGQAPVRVIAQKAGISRTNAYDVLIRLIRKGALTQVERGTAKKRRTLAVVAEDPSRLLSNVEKQRSVLEAILPDLRSIYSRSAATPRVRIYDGVEGIRTVLYDTLKCRSKLLLGILSMRDLLDVPGRAETEAYIRQRIDRGIFLRVLRSREKDVGNIWQSGEAELREVRYAPAGLVFTMTTWIYDDKVAIVSSRRENFGMTIESEEFAQMQQNLFSVLWNASQPDRQRIGPKRVSAV
jgi:sugar-specific transcriptional regulator TrmB